MQINQALYQKAKKYDFVLLFRKCSSLELASTIVNMRVGGVGSFRKLNIQSQDDTAQANNLLGSGNELEYSRRYVDKYLTRKLYEFSSTQVVELIGWETDLVVIAKRSDCYQGSEGILLVSGQKLHGAAFIKDEEAMLKLLGNFNNLNQLCMVMNRKKPQQILSEVIVSDLREQLNVMPCGLLISTDDEVNQVIVQQKNNKQYLICSIEEYDVYMEQLQVTAKQKEKINANIVANMYDALEKLFGQPDEIVIQVLIGDEVTSFRKGSSCSDKIDENFSNRSNSRSDSKSNSGIESVGVKVKQQLPVEQQDKMLVSDSEKQFTISIIPLTTKNDMKQCNEIEFKQFVVGCYESILLKELNNKSLIEKMQSTFSEVIKKEQSSEQLKESSSQLSVVHHQLSEEQLSVVYQQLPLNRMGDDK